MLNVANGSVVVPAICRFQVHADLDFVIKTRVTEARKWGWFRATELLVVVNTFLREIGCREINLREMFTNFRALNGHKEFVVIILNGKLTLLLPDFSNDTVDRPGLYVPAKWGFAVLDAIEHGYREVHEHVRALPFGNKLIGIRSNGVSENYDGKRV